MQSHWDGPDWSIAIIRYSFIQHTPSPPGYPLYIAIGKFLYLFTHDPHRAIVAVSVLFSGIGAVLFYVVGKQLFNRTVGIIASLIFLSAPTTYFFGITANPYGVLPITAAVLACVVYLILFKKRNYGFFLGIVFSFAIGFRPQDAIFLLPLFVIGFLSLKTREKYIALFSFILSFLFWFLPTAYAVGGINNYTHYVTTFMRNGTAPDISLSRISYIWFILLRGLYLTIGIAGIFLLFYFKSFYDFVRHSNHIYRSQKIKNFTFYALWIGPALFFNTFVRSDHAAHQMTYLSGLIFLVSFAIWKTTKKNTIILSFVVVVVALFNLLTFFRDRDPGNKKRYIDQSYHHSEIRKNDIRMKAKINFIERNYLPKDTIIFTTPTLWRPYMYYFKDYKIFEIDALGTKDKKFVDIRRDGQYWNKKEYKESVHSIVVPMNTKNIIVLDDDEPFKIVHTKSMEYRLEGGSLVYVIPVKGGEVFSYDLHFLKKN